MAEIKLLSEQVAQLIAAGEVVERPASVIKELLENSIDAGATIITVEIKNGGVTYMRITDNGSGIAPQDVRTAFLRHATSKISSQEDLGHIASLGFRGEALASIASVSRLELITRAADLPEGVRYELHGGAEIDFSEAGCPVGTTIVVRDIFYNTPARMKFLKKDVSEANAVSAVIDRIALSHPEISVKLIRDGEVKLQTPGDGRLFSAIQAVFGDKFASTLIETDYSAGGISVRGYISRPFHARATRSMQHFFINSRLVKSRTCMAAVEEAFRGSLMVGKFPACVLDIGVAHDSVDVNVHPAKIEVRFSDEKKIFDAVYFAVKNTLSGLDVTKKAQDIKTPAPDAYAPPQTQMYSQPFEISASQATFSPVKSSNITMPKGMEWDFMVLRDDGADDSYKTNQAKTAPAPSQPEQRVFFEPEAVAQESLTGRFDGAVIVGELFSTYIVMQARESVIIIDKHAAHERLIYEELIANLGSLQRQVLLSPLSVTLPKNEYDCALQNIAAFERLGFKVEDFGPGNLVIRETPLILTGCDAEDIVCEITEKLCRSLKNPVPDVLDELLCSVACKSAVRAHDKTHPLELERLIKLLSDNENVNFCPHGRPIATVITVGEIEKMFGRI